MRPIAARHLLALRRRVIPHRHGRRIFLQPSPHQLERQERMARIFHAENAKFVVLVHDLIPITYPEYVRPENETLRRCRIALIQLLADGIMIKFTPIRDRGR